MKKSVFSIISAFLLICLTSCSALSENFSSISVEFPEGISEQLKVSREIAAEGPVTCSLTVTGDYETTTSKDFASLDSINGSSITASDIPVDSKIKVEVGIYVNGLVQLYGTSNTFTVVKGDNEVNLELKPVTSVGITTQAPLEMVLWTNGKAYKSGSTIPYTTGDYYISLCRNNKPIEYSMMTIDWTCNNGLQVSEEAYVNEATETAEVKFKINNIANQNNTYTITYELGVTAEGHTGVYVYSSPKSPFTFTIESIVNTDFLLWDTDYSNQRYYVLSSLSEISEQRVKNENDEDLGFDYSNGDNPITGIKPKNLGGVINLNNEYISEGSDDDYQKLAYYDIENNVVYRYINHNPYKIAKKDLNQEETDFTEVEFPNEYSQYSYSFAAYKDYVMFFQPDSSIPKLNVIYYKKSNEGYSLTNTITYDLQEKTKIKDILVFENKIYILGANYYLTPDEWSETDGYTGTFVQKGALYVIDLNNPSTINSLGFCTADNQKTFTGINTDSQAKSANKNITLTVVEPAEAAKNSVFYAPQKIVAIKNKELYIADCGLEFESSDTEEVKAKAKNRVVTVNLKNFCITGTQNITDIESPFGEYNFNSATGYSYIKK